ncbi:MAG: RidA family protein [Deltaproteobacteria bacterium]|nr:RidA family protein [Deltaproteobacteria bacterium]
MKQIIQTQEAPGAIGPYSQAIKSGDLLFISGQIPLDPKTMQLVGSNAHEQAVQVLTNLQAVLKAAGANISSVVKTTIFLKDMGDFDAVNQVYAGVFKEQHPARSTIEVARLPKDVLVEVEAIARI